MGDIFNSPADGQMMPTEKECPTDYTPHKEACYHFSSHSSYEMAKKTCESDGARLADIEATHGKFVVDKVRSMGGNDFWIGSFRNGGRVLRQSGRKSCPVLRGQMINDALYGMVDCNSANRFVCQKFGPDNKPSSIDTRVKTMSTTPATTTTEKMEGTDGMSPVIYVVITIIVLIVAMIALKLITRKYFRDKKKDLKPTETKKGNSREKSPGNGIVFTPRRKAGDSKCTSLDSAVPPSETSSKSRRQLPGNIVLDKEESIRRMGRSKVNGSYPTRQPPGVTQSMTKDVYRRVDAAASTPPFGPEIKLRRGRRSQRRKHPHSRSRRHYYSDDSESPSTDSATDDTSRSGHGYGPEKVYQRQSSRGATPRDHYRGDTRDHFYTPPRRASTRGIDERPKQQKRNRNMNEYEDQSSDDAYYNARRGFYGDEYNPHNRPTDDRRVPTVAGNLPQHHPHAYGPPQIQYFPQPHRLVSWTNLNDLNDFPFQSAGQPDEHPKSFPTEPIRVKRNIHQKEFSEAQPRYASETDDQHIYESLEDAKRRKKQKKAQKKSKRRQSRTATGASPLEKSFKRTAESRASLRSVASIQSRKLPTPPIS